MGNNTKVSVIIPTMWRPECFPKVLEMVFSQEVVDEVIIISNAEPTFEVTDAKATILQQDKNIGVNPAWNLGVEKAKNETVVILNDDFLMEGRFFEEALRVKDSNAIVSINFNTESKEVERTTHRHDGFGCCFMIDKKDYVTIPSDLLVYFGDDWLFMNCILRGKTVALLPQIANNGILSETSRSFTSGVLVEFSKYSKYLDNLYKHEYKFSIVIPYHHSVSSEKEVNDLLDLLRRQTFSNYEILLIHDGPNPDQEKLNVHGVNYHETPVRYNDWGHSLRDLGLRMAKGEYIMFLNCDNLLREDALDKLNTLSEEPLEFSFTYGNHAFDSRDIMIYPIVLHGQTTDGFHLFRDTDSKKKMILTGYPPQTNYIDCMQLVMKRSKWIHYGGWYDKSFASDGNMYSRFVQENLGALYESEILGEHR